MSVSDNQISRRKLVGTLGAGLAAAAIPPVAQAQGASTAQPVADPTTKHLKPPYTSPFQPWPGLASKMTPPPDNGGTSYKGSGRLISGCCRMSNIHLERDLGCEAESIRGCSARRNDVVTRYPDNCSTSRWAEGALVPKRLTTSITAMPLSPHVDGVPR